MNNWQKFGLGSLIVLTLGYIKMAYFPSFSFVHSNMIPSISKDTEVEEKTSEEEKIEEVEKKPQKEAVLVYFIGQNKNQEEVYKIVKREYEPSETTSKVKFAVKNLLRGPNISEQKSGIYSEIPHSTKLISIEETPTKVVINLSSDFEQGGGTDGLYKRLYQLIKTVNKNTNLDVYLKINGRIAEVIGGEGIMITQPLNAKSLGE